MYVKSMKDKLGREGIFLSSVVFSELSQIRAMGNPVITRHDLVELATAANTTREEMGLHMANI